MYVNDNNELCLSFNEVKRIKLVYCDDTILNINLPQEIDQLIGNSPVLTTRPETRTRNQFFEASADYPGIYNIDWTGEANRFLSTTPDIISRRHMIALGIGHFISDSDTRVINQDSITLDRALRESSTSGTCAASNVTRKAPVCF